MPMPDTILPPIRPTEDDERADKDGLSSTEMFFDKRCDDTACTTSDLVDRHDRAYERGGRVVEGVDEGWVVDHPAHHTLENQSQRESREIMIREPTLS